MIEALYRAEKSGFQQWNDVHHDNEVYHGDEFLLTAGTVQCVGGIRVQIEERCQFARKTRWSERGDKRRLHLIACSYSAVLTGRGTIFRYDSADAVPYPGMPDHHKFHHVHRFDAPGTWEEIHPPIEVPEDQVPTISGVLQEAEEWYWKHGQG